MPRSRSRSRERRKRSRDRRSRSRDRKSRSRDRRSRSRDHKRKDRSPRRDRYERKDRDKSYDRHSSSRRRDKSADRSKKRDRSRDRHREKSTSRSRIIRRTPEKRSRTKPESSQMQNDESSNSSSKKVDHRTVFEIANEFSREGFEQFTRDHGIDFTNIETEEDRAAVHEKMEEVLKAHFAAQGKVYPPPKVEKPAINAATGFANDGSFMEQFKKMQEDYKAQLEAEKKRKAAEERLKSLPIRRRGGGKILKTGIVAKTKLNEDGTEVPTADAWSTYLKEVQKYKNASCDADTNTRPLVK